jgi:hypothetical protein
MFEVQVNRLAALRRGCEVRGAIRGRSMTGAHERASATGQARRYPSGVNTS